MEVQATVGRAEYDFVSDEGAEIYLSLRFKSEEDLNRFAEMVLKGDVLIRAKERRMSEETIQLSEREWDQFKTLDDEARDHYHALRFRGESHNMALMLATREGPMGKVADSKTPCPKRGAGEPMRTQGGGEIKGLKRKPGWH